MKANLLKPLVAAVIGVLILVVVSAAALIGRNADIKSAPEPADAAPVHEVEPRIHGHIIPAEMTEWSRSSMKLPPVVGEEHAVLTRAPEVPPVIRRNHATKVIVDLEIREVTKELADGVQYRFWTFGGDVPGEFIRVREGDLVEMHLHNDPGNTMPHNIDLHAVTGTGGGAEASLIVPGKTAVFSFRALNPGLYVYHCATMPVGMHIANGMYGMIFVQPKEGMPEVDREYYVMQSEFYTSGGFNDRGLQTFDMQKALKEQPDYVVFNGGVGQLAGANALQASVGQKVRFFVGNAGPNLTSSFHLIGEIFDTVYPEGGVSTVEHGIQTTSIPAGGAAIVEFQTDVPGKYTLVDHAIFRAMNKGALGVLDVIGPENKGIFSGQIRQEDYRPGSQEVAANKGK